jgi:aspartyl protease family protein
VSARKPDGRLPILFWVLMALLVAVVVIVIADMGPSLGLNDGNVGQLGYLVIVLLFVGSALLGRGLRAGEVVRSIAGWVVIFVALVAVYLYRDDLAGVGGRFLGVLAPGVPIAGRLVGEPDADSVVIIRAPDGHFAVRASVEDVPLTLLFDTGASFVTLTMADAAAVGVDLGTLDFAMPIRTANGVIEAAPITIGRLMIGTIERHDLKALVAQSDSLDQSLLGLSFLNTLNGYGIAGDRLVLTP